MPRLLDGDTRTDEIIRGIGRLIVSGGLEAVTMRRVAHEGGVSTGTLCHLLAFGELGRTTADSGRQVDEARAHERWLLAGCAAERLDPIAAVGAYATLEGLRAAICMPEEALSLTLARDLLAGAL